MITPKPKTFYKDRAIGGLYYCIGQFFSSSRDYVFDSSVGQRIVTKSRFEKQMEEVKI